jgi:hypothetical protein
MRFIQKIITPAQHYTPLVNNEPTDPGAWKARLVKQLLPHDASPFNQLIRDYLIEDRKPEDLSSLVCGCMEHDNVGVLTYILANEDLNSLYIEGPFSERGWKTLAKAMPHALHVTELTVSKEYFDVDKCKLLFKVLKHMHALEKVSLRKVTEEGGMLFDQLEWPNLPKLEELDVFAKSASKAGGGRLPLKILTACKVRRLRIEESGAISIHKHSKLAHLLRKQTRMESLRLRIDGRETPEAFACYMPFLCGKASLVELDLSGCFIDVGDFNRLIEAVSSNESALESLSLSRSLAGDPTYRETVSIDLLPLAKMKRLKHLDLSNIYLGSDNTVALLTALKEAATPLVTLNLSGNQIESQTISAIASLLGESEALRRLSLEPSAFQADLGDTAAIAELVRAVERNRSLLELQFRWPRDAHEYRASVDAYLDRNRKQAFMDAALQTAAAFVMPRLLMGPEDQEEFLDRRQLPQEFIRHIVGQGLTEHDALTLSSLNNGTRAAHEEFLRKTRS